MQIARCDVAAGRSMQYIKKWVHGKAHEKGRLDDKSSPLGSDISLVLVLSTHIFWYAASLPRALPRPSLGAEAGNRNRNGKRFDRRCNCMGLKCNTPRMRMNKEGQKTERQTKHDALPPLLSPHLCCPLS